MESSLLQRDNLPGLDLAGCCSFGPRGSEEVQSSNLRRDQQLHLTVRDMLT